MTALLIVLGVMLGVVAAAAILVLIVRQKIKNAASSALGVNGDEALRYISGAFKEEVNLPKSISNLTAVYAPKIKRDFPEIGTEGMERLARNALLESFNSLEAGAVGNVPHASEKLINYLKSVIADDKSKGVNERYDDVTIHKSGIAAYKNTGTAAEITYEFSLQYNDEKGLVQAVYEVYLSYNQNEYLESTSVVFSSNCPNCGAPVSAVGGHKVCEYCGSGLKEIADRVWQCDGFRKTK